ncbi:MAG: hypothetical protein AB1627_01260 [Chloroflexota bacterium]
MSCLRCGDESADVRMALVDLEAEAREDGEPLGTVTVAIADGEGPRGPRGLAYAVVPARYAHEPRCRDRDACRRRAADNREPEPLAVVPPAEAHDEEVVPWL